MSFAVETTTLSERKNKVYMSIFLAFNVRYFNRYRGNLLHLLCGAKLQFPHYLFYVLTYKLYYFYIKVVVMLVHFVFRLSHSCVTT
jgi:hypothetical protein